MVDVINTSNPDILICSRYLDWAKSDDDSLITGLVIGYLPKPLIFYINKKLLIILYYIEPLKGRLSMN